MTMKKFVRALAVYPRTANERAFLKELFRRSQIAHAALTSDEIEDFALGHLMSKADPKKKVAMKELKAQLKR